MSNTQTSSSHGKLIVSVAAAVVVVVLALVSAFIWPGWALNGSAGTAQEQQSEVQSAEPTTPSIDAEPTTPSIDAVALPDDASELLKAMPDSVLNFARTNADASVSWGDASPLEEYTLTYSTGTDGQEVTLVAAQWSQSDDAKTQYDALAAAMTGEELGSGNVKVSGETTGAYSVKTNPDDENKAVALWQNGTVVFQATGSVDSVQRFYQEFPL